MHPAAPLSSRQMALHADTRSVRAILRLAGALAASGKRIDLAGLDDQIGRLCAGILDLPPEAGRHWQSELRALAEETATLHTTLSAQSPPRAETP